jgi:NAD(P)-dependent dehydrogenase (short-subunit alcohol dehydrogenase family)
MTTPRLNSALIVGAGSGLSAALARALAADGIKVALAARSTEDLAPLAKETGAQTFACDASKRTQVDDLFAALDAQFGAPEIAIYNASFRTRGALLELDPADVEQALAVTAYGGFLVGQQAARRMLPNKRGAIVFTGASASVKGYAQSAPFAMGKFALRGLAQSMRSPAPICTLSDSRAAPGPGRSSCGPGWSGFRCPFVARVERSETRATARMHPQVSAAPQPGPYYHEPIPIACSKARRTSGGWP